MGRRAAQLVVLAFFCSGLAGPASAQGAWDGWVGTITVSVLDKQTLASSATTFSRGSSVELTGPGSRRDTSSGTGSGFLSSVTTYPQAIICGQRTSESSRAEGSFSVEVAVTEDINTYTVVPIGGTGLPLVGVSRIDFLCPLLFPPIVDSGARFAATVGLGTVAKDPVRPNVIERTIEESRSCGLLCTQTKTTHISLRREAATLEVRKELEPSADPGRFDLLIDDEVKKAAAGDEGTTGGVTVLSGGHTVSEESAVGTDGRATALANYSRQIACVDRATGTTVAQGTGSSLGVDLEPGDDVVCTITNRLRPLLEVEKQTTPDGATTTFAFSGAVSGTARDGEVISARVDPGSQTITETATGGWFVDSIVCNASHTADLPAGKVTVDLAMGQTVRCTFRNSQDCVGKSTQRSYAGRIPGIPENIVTWDVSVNWCYTGETTRLLSPPTLFGDVPRSIFGTAVLEELGALSFSYNADLSHIDPESQAGGVTLVTAEPQFDMCLDFVSLIVNHLPGFSEIGGPAWKALKLEKRLKVLLKFKKSVVALVRKLRTKNEVFTWAKVVNDLIFAWYDELFRAAFGELVEGNLFTQCTPAYLPILKLRLLPNGGVGTSLSPDPNSKLTTVLGTL